MTNVENESLRAVQPGGTDNLIDEVRACLVSTLQLQSVDGLAESTPLLGGIPELDSMAVVTVILALEEHFGFVADDEEISADTFETLGTLCAFVESKM